MSREFSSPEELERAYAELRSAYRAQTVDMAELELARKENKELREQMRFLERSAFTRAGAEVIGKNIEPHSSTVVLNRGVEDGIAVGNPVIAGTGILVGKVKRVEKRTSIVQLLNDQESKIAAQVLNEEDSPGIVLGGYKISVRMRLIPQNENVQIGDLVVTSGLEEGIPKGLVIGRIEAVIKEAYQPFQEAIIVPTYPLEKLTTVSVLTRVES